MPLNVDSVLMFSLAAAAVPTAHINVYCQSYMIAG